MVEKPFDNKRIAKNTAFLYIRMFLVLLVLPNFMFNVLDVVVSIMIVSPF